MPTPPPSPRSPNRGLARDVLRQCEKCGALFTGEIRGGRLVFQSQHVVASHDELLKLWKLESEKAEQTGLRSDRDSAQRLLFHLRDARRDAERGAPEKQMHESCGGFLRTVDNLA